jgi:hypothetical protein
MVLGGRSELWPAPLFGSRARIVRISAMTASRRRWTPSRLAHRPHHSQRPGSGLRAWECRGDPGEARVVVMGAIQASAPWPAGAEPGDARALAPDASAPPANGEDPTDDEHGSRRAAHPTDGATPESRASLLAARTDPTRGSGVRRAPGRRIGARYIRRIVREGVPVSDATHRARERQAPRCLAPRAPRWRDGHAHAMRRRGDWSGRRGSNPRHPAWKAGAPPTELLPPDHAAGRRRNVRSRWQFAQTISHLAASARIAAMPARPTSLVTPMTFRSASRWSKSMAHGGNRRPQSAHGRSRSRSRSRPCSVQR